MVEQRQEQAAEDARSRPAQAGIQCFMSYIPAQAGMTIRQDWRSFHIPAFAGMTAGGVARSGGLSGSRGSQESLMSTAKAPTPIDTITPSLMVSLCSVSLMVASCSLMASSSALIAVPCCSRSRFRPASIALVLVSCSLSFCSRATRSFSMSCFRA